MGLLRLGTALVVMLLAVLPHATLAASTFHMTPGTSPAHAHGAMPDQHAAHGAPAATPCHDEGSDDGSASPAMPSCCILGCGLLGSGPFPETVVMAARWQRLAPSTALTVTDEMPEPAERPPRRAGLRP
ncbi:MAG: hypothetical protein DCF30_00170 [Hyphomicrobiales bacterium]|nr:MAG: hypothetical protein DCF30_00170 [Hyphomicrobiales bacterium]